MNINRKILAIGALLVIAGIITALLSYNPSQILQYVYAGVSGIIAMLGIAISRRSKNNFVRSQYYKWIGIILFAFAISLSLWATTLVAFITVLGFFILLLGIGEFVFALQILGYTLPIPWRLLAVKLVISAVAAVGAAWILTMSEINANVALFFSGVLVVVIGLGFIHVSRITITGPAIRRIAEQG